MEQNKDMLFEVDESESTQDEKIKNSFFQEKIIWFLYAIAIGVIILAIRNDWIVIGFSGIAFLIGVGIYWYLSKGSTDLDNEQTKMITRVIGNYGK